FLRTDVLADLARRRLRDATARASTDAPLTDAEPLVESDLEDGFVRACTTAAGPVADATARAPRGGRGRPPAHRAPRASTRRSRQWTWRSRGNGPPSCGGRAWLPRRARRAA